MNKSYENFKRGVLGSSFIDLLNLSIYQTAKPNLMKILKQLNLFEWNWEFESFTLTEMLIPISNL